MGMAQRPLVPAKAGTQDCKSTALSIWLLGSRLRGNERGGARD
jgi:hypothetical protein